MDCEVFKNILWRFNKEKHRYDNEQKYLLKESFHQELAQIIVLCEALSNIPSIPGSSVGEESACNAGDPGLIPGSGRSPEKEMATHSSIPWENPTDRGAWQATVHRVARVRQDLVTKPPSPSNFPPVQFLLLSVTKRAQSLLPSSVHFSSVTQLCPTLCDLMNSRTPGLPIHHHSRSLLKLMPIKSVMPSSHLILCRPLLLLPPISPSISVFK